ncbi:MAG TPA: gamma-glutamyl-gamma-aminobutyrate hydrolase family protein [Firmicutes bacterium]|nr:gamma-glutamyl-gamma-aminobutyrate hydrolase family protein [Bacillota bacterium]
MKPVIGVTCRHDRKQIPDQYMLAGAYCRAIEKAGGIPVLLPAQAEFDRPLHSFCQGLLLSGGGDIDPAFFNEEPHPRLGTVDQERDRWELLLVRKAYAEGLSMLGICRGVQVLNVAFGGTLYQDLPAQYAQRPNRPLLEHNQQIPGDQVSHRVTIAAGSLLARILESTEIWTNSHHHQAVKDPAPNLRITARSDDGVIEGLEGTGDHFLVGVQWHPERLASPDSQRLFAAFVRACR